MTTPPVTAPADPALPGPGWAARGTQRRRWISVVAGTTVGVLLLAIVVGAAGVDDVWRNWQRVEPLALTLYALLTIGVYVMRALRFRVLIGTGANVPVLHGIVSVHTLMVNLLPFSAGDVSYPVLLKRYRVRPDLLGGVPSLLVARIQDLLITGAFLFVALGQLRKPAEVIALPVATPGRMAFALLALLGAGVLAVAVALPRVRRRLEPVARPIWLGVRMVGPRAWVKALAVGVIARLIAIVAVSYLFRAVGIALPLGTVLLINTLYTLLPLLPINAIAGLGITQAYLVMCFMASGIDHGVAAAASVQIHGLQLLIAALLAALGYLQLQYGVAREARARA